MSANVRRRRTRPVRTTIEDKTPSNAPIGLSGWVLMFALLIWASRFLSPQPPIAGVIAIASLSLPFFATAIAQLRSGYLWRNLSPGFRGLHRSEAPTRFALSTVFHFSLASGFIILALWRYSHQA